ncbi:potassium channel family protein [Planctomycetota bacterium]|nr:potassium channel family protein [Planctomycetota bacterium]
MPYKKANRTNPTYQILMIILSILVLVLLTIEALMTLSDDVQYILQFMDLCICIVFAADFIRNTIKTDKKKAYLMGWGLLDLLSCIPMIDALRYFRITRILRALRLLRGIRAAKTLTDFVLLRNAGNTFFAAFIASIFLIAFSSIAILSAEKAETSNIHNAQEAIWWSITTITTVGYGDKFPVTMEGRLVAALLMIWGLGIFGTFTGFIATWFQESDEENQTKEIIELKHEIKELRKLIERQSESTFNNSA